MSPTGAYRRTWAASAGLVVTALAVYGLVATRPSHLPALAAASAGAGLAGLAWAVTAPGPVIAATPCPPRVVRRTVALFVVGLLAAVGAGHGGTTALLVVAVHLACSPAVVGAALRADSGRAGGQR